VKSRTLVVTVVKDSHSLVDLVDIAVDTVLPINTAIIDSSSVEYVYYVAFCVRLY